MRKLFKAFFYFCILVSMATNKDGYNTPKVIIDFISLLYIPVRDWVFALMK